MLKIDPHSKSLLPLGRRTLEPAPLFGRLPVLDLVANSADVFFADLGRALFLLGRNVPVNSKADRCADLLLIDPDGRLFVGRLQKGKQYIDLVETLEDAGCIANWGPDRVLSLLDDARRELLQQAFLKAPLEKINAEQGLLLLAESYDLDTLAAAGWLKARYGVRIECFQLRLATDALTQIDYLNCQDLSAQLNRIYQRRKSGEADGAPWPAAAVPDISDGPKPEPPKAKTEAPQAAAAEDLTTPPPPEPVQPQPEAVRARAPEPAAAPETPPEPEPEPEPEPVEAAPVETAPLEAEVAAALDEADTDEAPAAVEEMVIPDDLAPEDDPLAEVIAGLEAAEEPPMQGPPPSERRVAGRSRDYQARRLRLDYFGRLLGARLVDFSSSGLGVEALSPLPVGAEIGISGELTSEAGTLGIEGRAKVEHCRSTEDGVCRIGFSLDKAKVSELDDPETFDRR